MKMGKKVKRYLQGGPFDKHTLYLTGDGSSTLMFGIGSYYGRYVQAYIGSISMDWQAHEPN